MERLFEAIQASAHSALLALVRGDEQMAQSVIANRNAILALAAELQRQQSARFAGDDPNHLIKYRLQFEMLDRLRRIYSVAEHMAMLVLPRSVLASGRLLQAN